MHRPAPVAHPAVTSLASHPEDVAKRWLVVLLDAAPLADAPRVPLDAIASEGPPLCQAAVRALASEEALTALLGARGGEPGAADMARIAGCARLSEAVEAAEALRRALLDAVAERLPHEDLSLLPAIGDRAAHVCARLAAESADALAGGRPAAPEPEEPATPFAPRPLRPASSERPAPLWLAALERRLADGGRVAVLLVELDGAERLRQSEDEEAEDVFARAGRAVRAALRRADLLAHEEGGRMWVVAGDAGRTGAESLAARVAGAVERTATLHGAPITASVGMAVFPEDGRDAAALADRAEENTLAARAAGLRVAPPDGGEDAGRLGPRRAR